MHSTKKPRRAADSPEQKSRQNDAKAMGIVHTHLSLLLSDLQSLNPPADKVQANWMVRGHVQSLKIVAQKMVVHVRPSKSIPEGIYKFWTVNPGLKLQLFSAHLCNFVVDIFSIAPEKPSYRSPKDGGEILTLTVDQENA